MPVRVGVVRQQEGAVQVHAVQAWEVVGPTNRAARGRPGPHNCRPYAMAGACWISWMPAHSSSMVDDELLPVHNRPPAAAATGAKQLYWNNASRRLANQWRVEGPPNSVLGGREGAVQARPVRPRAPGHPLASLALDAPAGAPPAPDEPASEARNCSVPGVYIPPRTLLIYPDPFVPIA
jgi:hypothetical protein